MRIRKQRIFWARMQNNSGIMLLIVLWMIMILSLMVLGLGRRAGVELALTKYQIGKAKAGALAQAGLFYAIAQVRKDSLDPEARKADTFYLCGVAPGPDETPEDLFRNVPFADGFFDVGFAHQDHGGQMAVQYGFRDEESRINLNALDNQNYPILKFLLEGLGVDGETAETIAASVIDWKDPDGNTFHAPYGAEDSYYSRLQPAGRCKDYAFESVDELRLVRGMTDDIFSRVRDYVTVFPSAGRLQVNLDTASRPVLAALAMNLTGERTNTEQEDAESLVDKISGYRAGDDGAWGTADDRVLDIKALALNSEERILAMMLLTLQTKVSNYFRVHVTGIHDASAVPSEIEAVIFRDDQTIFSWERI